MVQETAAPNAATAGWFVYVVRCADGTLYTGITTDVQRRLQEHNGDNRLGARYTRVRRPVVLCYFERAENRSEAARREAVIKRLSRSGKEELISVAARTCESCR